MALYRRLMNGANGGRASLIHVHGTVVASVVRSVRFFMFNPEWYEYEQAVATTTWTFIVTARREKKTLLRNNLGSDLSQRVIRRTRIPDGMHKNTKKHNKCVAVTKLVPVLDKRPHNTCGSAWQNTSKWYPRTSCKCQLECGPSVPRSC